MNYKRKGDHVPKQRQRLEASPRIAENHQELEETRKDSPSQGYCDDHRMHLEVAL